MSTWGGKDAKAVGDFLPLQGFQQPIKERQNVTTL